MTQSLTKYMPGITAAVLLAFVAYGVAWYFNAVESNFSLILLLATIMTGVYWLMEKWIFLPQRKLTAAAVQAEQSKPTPLPQPWWLDWTAGLFPVICAVFLLRSFLVEPFKIPTGSMIPTLLVGDLILVNKFTYGIRLPVINKKIMDVNSPQRGDVMVFRYPPNPNVDYIKRVIGLPGDVVTYTNKELRINGQLVPRTSLPEFFDETQTTYLPQFEEKLPGQREPHRLLILARTPVSNSPMLEFPFFDQCSYSIEGVSCKVPAGQYFMMGDNRDNSQDSRFWGFVPEQNIVGKAFFVWMNFGNLGRIGAFH